MDRKFLAMITVLIVGASLLALGCTGESGTGPTATPALDTSTPDQANGTMTPPLPPADMNGTHVPGGFNGTPPGFPDNGSFQSPPSNGPGSNDTAMPGQ